MKYNDQVVVYSTLPSNVDCLQLPTSNKIIVFLPKRISKPKPKIVKPK